MPPPNREALLRLAVAGTLVLPIFPSVAAAQGSPQEPLEPRSGHYVWTAGSDGLLQGPGGEVRQTEPNPRTMDILVWAQDDGTLLLESPPDEVTLQPVPEGHAAWTWEAESGPAISSDELELVAGRPLASLPRWAGRTVNREGVRVTYNVILVADGLFLGKMRGERDGLTFTRTFTMSEVVR